MLISTLTFVVIFVIAIFVLAQAYEHTSKPVVKKETPCVNENSNSVVVVKVPSCRRMYRFVRVAPNSFSISEFNPITGRKCVLVPCATLEQVLKFARLANAEDRKRRL